MPSDIVAPLAYRPADAARALGIGKTRLYKYIHDGEIELVRLTARTSIIPASSLFAFMERRHGARVSEVQA